MQSFHPCIDHMWQGSHRNRYELLQTCQCTFLKHLSITNNIWKRKKFSVDGLLRYRNFKIWRPLKQTKSKNGHHFFISTFDNLQLCFLVQKGSCTLKVLEMQFVFGWAYDKEHSIFNLQCSLLIMAQPKTNCNFHTIRVEESFWTKKQSCNV